MAEVYLAEQQSLARQVALKVLASELASQPAYVERFQHEARSAAALVHANIVQVYEVGQANGSHFIAQEYVAGQNLSEWLRRHGRVEPGRVLDILRQVAAALSKAHEQSIVHRDVKPENIMLSRSGEVKVADFGLARVTTDDATGRTQAGVAMGTPLYMSPEQIEGRSIDSRSDIYSLGITAYHMLAGEPPFQGDTPLAVAMQHVNKAPPPLAERAADTPQALIDVVQRMMAKQPENRYANPVDLLRALRQLAKQAAEDGWAEGPENWSLSDIAGLSQTHLAATGELERAMQSTRAIGLPRSKRNRTVRLVAVSLVVGAALALLLRRPYVLAGDEPTVEIYNSAREQLFHAKWHDTPEAWLAVLENFPKADAFDRNLAKQGLARWYLHAGDYHAALPYLADLATVPESQETTRTFAHVGLAVAHAELGNLDQARRSHQMVSASDLAAMDTDADLMQMYRELDL